MSIKEVNFEGNDLIPSENYSLRISMENLGLRNECRGMFQRKLCRLCEKPEQIIKGWTMRPIKEMFWKELKVCFVHSEV